MSCNWKKYFIGARSSTKAAALTPQCEIRLFYRHNNVFDLALPLHIVYRDCQDETYEIPLEKSNGYWQLCYEGSAKFADLGRLLDHYYNYLMSCQLSKRHGETDICWESFPIWNADFRSLFHK